MAAAVFNQSIGASQSLGHFNTSGCIKSLGKYNSSLDFPDFIDRYSFIPSHNKSNDSRKKSGEAALILIRHGESLWNEKNLFTGCVDVPLTKKGVEEAIEAGKRISNIPIDMIYTSALIRAQMTAMLAMTQHRRKKGLNKQETADRYGKEQVHEWRRSYDVPPPNGESLEMCAQRAVAYFKDQVISLELSTGIPMLYISKEGKFIRREVLPDLLRLGFMPTPRNWLFTGRRGLSFSSVPFGVSLFQASKFNQAHVVDENEIGSCVIIQSSQFVIIKIKDRGEAANK
ncbi:Phosphoglycerate mutase family protein [Prunus dulcis]|uniref:phosphoglycerate mutase (2,3-diphosphoglycerate-dependent) n=1 Tax=Prunus dulcis TaxID=3755 RepID=A0A4Y1RG58_PRUDU|nr:Phosphoglycerate mutase family protein [Prunus dulcis]